MATALALGKATGPAFMGNAFVFSLAGLVGYRVVWGVQPSLALALDECYKCDFG